MDWYKHSTSSHDDPDISDAMDEFGHSAYSVFFILLELYGQEFNHINGDGWLTLSKSFLERKLRCRWLKRGQTLEQCWSSRGVDRGKLRSYFGVILEFYRSRGRFDVQETPETVSIRIPKFIEVASNWTKRTKTLPTESLQSPSVVPTAIEEEEEEEEEEEKKKHLCLHKEIVQTYNGILGHLLTPVRYELWNGSERYKNLQARWRSGEKYQTLEFWRGLFEYIRDKCPFLIGTTGQTFKADLGWIVKKNNFIKIIEGKYERR